MARPEALTLDLFGTLVDFEVQRDEPPLVADLLAEEGLDLDEQLVLDTWLRASLDERARRPFRTVRVALVRGARDMAQGLGLEIDPEAWATALEDRWAASPLHDDVAGSLDRLDTAGVAYGLVTNLDRSVLDRVLATTGLGARIEVAVCSETARAYKPHPRPFHLALSQLGVEASTAVHIGNSRTEDLPGARAAGMGCRLVRGEHGGLAQALDAILDPA